MLCINVCISCCIPGKHSKCCAHSESHNEGDVLDGIDLQSNCIWIQTEVVREVEAKETAEGEHLYKVVLYNLYSCN